MKSFIFPMSCGSAAVLLGVLQTASAASFDPASGMVSLTKVDAGSLGNYSVTMRYVPPLVVLQSADPISSAASADASFSATTGSLLIPALSVGTAKYKVSLQQVAGSFDFNITSLDFANDYSLVDTGQSTCYDTSAPIDCPASGASFVGQDAQFSGVQPSYTKSSDGLTVKDNVTGLTWQQNHSTAQVYWAEAEAIPAALNAANYGGYNDWRLPTIKELYSLWNGGTGWPYIDTNYFTVNYTSEMELSHAIFWSSTKYTGLLESTVEPETGAEMAFGVNFGTGHIKAYAISTGPRHLARCVRGDVYGVNNFKNNSDGTITDQSTGLMWAQADSGSGMDWQHALAFAQTQNAANYLGHNDWRLPNSKELQNIVDYTHSPGATDATKVGPAIDPLFSSTGITNEAGTADYPWYWTSTSAKANATAANDAAWYVSFGRAVGSDGKDLHGAGAVRFDAKVQGASGGEDRGSNYVRLVRDAK